MIIGSVYIGSSEVFQFESYRHDTDEGVFTCSGRLTVYASKVARNPIRPFVIRLTQEGSKPFTLYGILLRCTHNALEIQELTRKSNETLDQNPNPSLGSKTA